MNTVLMVVDGQYGGSLYPFKVDSIHDILPKLGLAYFAQVEWYRDMEIYLVDTTNLYIVLGDDMHHQRHDFEKDKDVQLVANGWIAFRYDGVNFQYSWRCELEIYVNRNELFALPEHLQRPEIQQAISDCLKPSKIVLVARP